MSQTALLPNQAMALSQLYTNEINDPALLDAVASTPRHLFVPKHLENCAYIDEDLNLGEGRYMLAALEQARIIQAAALKPTDRVLNIASAAGYSAAIIAKLAGYVIGIDSSAMFKQRGEEQFKELGIENAEIQVVEDITQGYEKHAPYDAILINGNLQTPPDHLISQLNNGGRLVYIECADCTGPGVQGIGKLIVSTLSDGQINKQHVGECFVPKLTEFDAEKGFEF